MSLLMKPCRLRKTGFTLVEMLVVLAIIAVIAAISFAVIGRARGKGREAVCLSNLHQLSVGMGMYRADWDGQYPRDLRDFNKPYVNNTNVYYCPDDTRPGPKGLPSPDLVAKGFGPGLNNPSYIYHSPPLIGDKFTEVYQRRGESTPIVVDEWHNTLSDRQEGKAKHYLVLRLDGSIKLIQSEAKSSLDL